MSLFRWSLARKITVLTVIPFIVIFLCLFIYHVIIFLPYKSKIDEALTSANFEDREPPQNVRQLINSAHNTGRSLDGELARIILVKMLNQSPPKMLFWHIQYSLWSILIPLNLSESEKYGLYCALSYNGQDYGANELAIRLFSKPLSQLSDEEAAEVVTILWSPSLAQSPDKLKRRSHKLLLDFQNQKNIR